jgi:hypothetical protein
MSCSSQELSSNHNLLTILRDLILKDAEIKVSPELHMWFLKYLPSSFCGPEKNIPVLVSSSLIKICPYH